MHATNGGPYTSGTGSVPDRGGCRSIDYISRMEHGVVIAVGSGKQGKSCSLHSLISLCWPDREKCLLDQMEYDVSVFPGYTRVSSPSEVPVGSVVVVEDVNRVFHSRGSSRDATLQRWLGIISHRSNVVCITTQSMADTDVAFVRSQDAVVMHKRMHEEDLAFERPEFRVNQALANHWISRSIGRHPDIDERAWCFFPRFRETVPVPKVDWWSYANSHMLREAVI
ncbi:MAG: hypothetical protein IJ026_03545 [Candidatus Methanomethylophilaceae archaeon]|nr:hypothetical protein [Candidatus Methanomethylophilaceae archaeon]